MRDIRRDVIRAEVIVIGSGPGGAITAALLAEAGHSVLLIEEGRDLPVDSAPHFTQQEMLQKYRNGGATVALGRNNVAYVEGRCVGGGSEINRGLYRRAPAALLERWRRDYAVQETTLEDLIPHFRACEETTRISYLKGEAPGFSARLKQGAEALGWRADEAPRLVRYDRTAEPAMRQSMTTTFLPRFLKAGGRLLPDSHARFVRQEGGHWYVDVQHRPAGQPARMLSLRCDRLVLACGAVQTPALLRRSGLRRNVGNGLRFHPMLKAVGLFDASVNGPLSPDPVHQITEFEPEIGIGCSISTSATLALALAAHGDAARMVARHWPRMGLFYAQTVGGRGKVRTPPGFHDPLVTFRQTATERTMLMTALGHMARALFAAGATAVYPAISGLPVLREPDDIARLPARLGRSDSALSAVHIFSSCPMGEDKARCVTDSFGRVHGVRGLHIADASLLCTATGVNPQGTVMALAHRNATRMLAEDMR